MRPRVQVQVCTFRGRQEERGLEVKGAPQFSPFPIK